MDGATLVGEIVEILVAGLTSFGTGLGQAISNFATALAFTGTGSDQQLSVYFILVLAFCAISLCVGITTRLFLWLGSLGRN